MLTQPTLFPSPVTSDATISACGRYRYSLSRTWDSSLPSIAFLMLNPSKADASQDDPTIRRCVSFARAWGAGALILVNLFALRATDPASLLTDPDPVGPENDKAILDLPENYPGIVAAWGAHGTLNGRGREVMEMLAGKASLGCLGLTKGGQPRHPLYVAGATELRPFERIGGGPRD